MKKRSFLAGAFLMVSASVLFANPIDPSARPVLSGLDFAALVAEALVVAGLLAWRKFRFSRVFFAWLPVTMVTYWYMTGGLRLLLETYEGFALRYWLTILLLEIIAVLIEAWVIAKMAESRFFREPQTPFPYAWALGVSIAGNVVSFGIGLLGS